MVDIPRLRHIIKDSGMTIKAVAEKSGIRRETLYNRFAGKGEFTVSEVLGLTQTLRLTKQERDEIFLS